jgi:hypothetical protein
VGVEECEVLLVEFSDELVELGDKLFVLVDGFEGLFALSSFLLFVLFDELGVVFGYFLYLFLE